MEQVRIKVANRGGADRRYRMTLAGAPGARLIASLDPLPVAAGTMRTTAVFVIVPHEAFEHGQRAVTIHVADDARFAVDVPYTLIGPVTAHDEAREGAR
jgi:FixG-like putative oxidoreductase